jgi:hypothetical protein
MSLSIVIPSCGRTTLENTVNGLLVQMTASDEIIIVGPRFPGIWTRYTIDQVKHIICDNRGCDERNIARGKSKGGPEKDAGFKVSTGTHILTIDDDDIYMKDALILARAAIAEVPDRPHIFRMRYGIENQWRSPLTHRIEDHWELGFEQHGLTMGNIGSAMYIYPARAKNVPHLRSRHGDEDFYTFIDAVALCGSPVWHDRAWGIIRPSLDDLREHVGDRFNTLEYARQPMFCLPDTPENRLRIERWRVWRDLGGEGEPPAEWDGKPRMGPQL